MNYWLDQALRSGYRNAHVDALLQDNLVAAPGGVKSGVLFQRLHHHFDDERQVSQFHSLSLLETVPQAVAPGGQVSYVYFHSAPGVGNLGYAADHRLGNHPPHWGERHVLFVGLWSRRGGWRSRGLTRLRRRGSLRDPRGCSGIDEFHHVVAGNTPTH